MRYNNPLTTTTLPPTTIQIALRQAKLTKDRNNSRWIRAYSEALFEDRPVYLLRRYTNGIHHLVW